MTNETIIEGKSRDSDEGKAKLQKFKDRMAKRANKVKDKNGDNDTNEEIVSEVTQDEIDNPDFAHNLLVNAIGEKPAEFTTAFQDAMRDRISGKVAAAKVELASELFGAPEEQEETPEDATDIVGTAEVKEPEENDNISTTVET